METSIRIAIALLLALTASSPALAGDDIADWRQLCARQLQGDPAIAAWSSFVQAHPSSILAEVAWGRLDAAGAIDPAWLDDPVLAGVARSYAAHQQALQRTAQLTAVARLDADGTVDPQPAKPAARPRGRAVASQRGKGR